MGDTIRRDRSSASDPRWRHLGVDARPSLANVSVREWPATCWIGSVAFAMRLAGFWLAACSLGVGVAFLDRELALLPDFYVASWLGHTACLFLVAGAAVSLVVLKSIMRTGAWTIAILIGGHLAAMACTHEFLASRIRCVDIQNGFDYRIPDDTGA